MKKINQRTIIVLAFLAVCAFAVFAWAVVGRVFFTSGQDVKDHRGFAEAQRLEGQWVRPDGGYTLVIGDIKPDGTLNVSYYNPRKINVHEAKWEVDNDSVHLFVELRDLNYPGSKYSLVHAKRKNALEGTYFQAVHKQTFNVSFMRKN